MIGTVLKGYRIVEKVKDGGTGTVYRAVNAADKSFAVKVLHEQFCDIPHKRKAFRREEAVTRSLKHSGIIRCLEYVNARRPCIIMEYFESENLSVVAKQHRDWLTHYRLSLIRQVTEALFYAHQQGIIHRDVKPDNVLISPEGEIRLIDFSIAVTKLQRLLPFLIRQGGTPAYMAPEQIRNKGMDARVDQYALGVLVYELYAGEVPFTAPSTADLFQKHISASVPPLKGDAVHVPREIDALVRKMMAKNPAERFPDLLPVIHELRKLEARKPATKLSDTAIRRWRAQKSGAAS